MDDFDTLLRNAKARLFDFDEVISVGRGAQDGQPALVVRISEEASADREAEIRRAANADHIVVKRSLPMRLLAPTGS